MLTAVLALVLPPLVPQGTSPCDLTPTYLDGFAGGHAMSLSEGRLLYGVELYVDQAGEWVEEATLLTPETTSISAPSSVIDGDTAIVGHPLNDDFAMDNGSVEIFVRDGAVWSLEARLYAPSPGAGDFFGYTVDVDGDVAVVGAPERGVGGTAFVFERTGTTWSFVTELVPGVPEPDAVFGRLLAVSGNTALVAGLSGDAFVFVDEGAGWGEQGQLGLPSVRALDLSGETAIVRAPPSTLVFVREGTMWTQQAAFPSNDLVQSAVALAGDVASTTGSDDFFSFLEVYVRAGTTWTKLAETADVSLAVRGIALAPDRLVFSQCLGTCNLYETELPPFVAPSVGFRNAGTNPNSHTSTPAYIGQSLHFTVDLTTTGHDQALVFGFDSPFGLTLGGGQTLLCFDLLGSGGELINTGFHPGPVVEIELPVPNLLALGGFEVSTQALHAFGAVPFALSNAQDLVIGACY